MRGVAITPADRFRRFVVMPNVSSNLAREIGDGGKDATRQKIALDLGKPEFDLVQPGGVRWRKVNPHVGMLDQKRPHRLRFMGREVVRDHMDLSALRLAVDDLAEKLDERRAGVA